MEYKPYILYMEHAEAGTSEYIGEVMTPEEAEEIVRKFDENNEWEGHDAILMLKKSGKRWGFADRWELIE